MLTGQHVPSQMRLCVLHWAHLAAAAASWEGNPGVVPAGGPRGTLQGTNR
jgi:hypothetical protein